MRHTVVLLAVLAACGSQRTPITTKVTTLGYALPPSVVVIGRGPDDLVRPWIDGLRAAKHVKVIAELAKTDEDWPTDDEMCREAREAANVTPIDEIIVIRAVQSELSGTACTSYQTPPNCGHPTAPSTMVTVNTSARAYRASSCTIVRETTLPIATGTSWRTPEQDLAPSTSEEPIDDATPPATREARDGALAKIRELAPLVSWDVFPRDSSIQRIEGNKMTIAGPHPLRDYSLKTPSSSELVPGVRAVDHTVNQTTFEIDEAHVPEPGDELHTVTDMVTVAGYMSVSGGTAIANGKQHGVGGVGFAARWSWDHKPWMFDAQLGSDFVPGVDSRVISVNVAAGLRFPYWITPVAFVALGIGGVYQGDHGARAAAVQAGVGAGLEVRRSRWFAFADARIRGFAFDEFTDSESNPLHVDYPDDTWRTTTGQLGLGFHY